MVVGKDASERDGIITFLKDAGCCKHCILRCLGERTYTFYCSWTSVDKRLEELGAVQLKSENGPFHKQECDALKQNIAENVDSEVPASKRPRTTPCIACLGLLEDNYDTIVNKVEDKVQKSGFQFSTFLLQLSVPVTTDLRHHILFLHLKDFFREQYDAVSSESLPTVKEVWKWVVGSQLCKAVSAEFSPHSSFQVSVFVTYPDIEDECKLLEKECPEAFPNRKRKRKKTKPEEVYTRTAVIKALNALPVEIIKRLYVWPPAAPRNGCQYESINCTHSPLYVAGRYNKYSRQLSQTPWVVDGEKKMKASVQELIVSVIEQWMPSDKIIFSASGREDVDVKMLGRGRPFLLELINPRLTEWSVEDILKMQMEINSSTEDIEVRDLQIVTREDTQHLKEGEEEKKKTYSALCCVSKPLDQSTLEKLASVKDLQIRQKTPIRVLHRRPLAVRERLIHQIVIDSCESTILRLHLTTQAGTYVKEFVHGDFGRTIPHLGMLIGTEADIMELDVESVDLDWPPSLST